MRMLILVLMALCLSACNELTDVVIVTGEFKHTAEFEERGLTLTVFHYDDVVSTLNEDYDLEVPVGQVVKQYVSAINNAAAGRVILNFPGGYDEVFESLQKYPGRKIYCAGASYWEVSIPDGCIAISSIYAELNRVAPVNVAVWRQAHAEIANAPRVLTQFPTLFFTESPSILAIAEEFMSNHDGYIFISNESVAEQLRETPEIARQLLLKQHGSVRGDENRLYIMTSEAWSPPDIDYATSLINWYLSSPRPNCEASAWALWQYYSHNQPSEHTAEDGCPT